MHFSDWKQQTGSFAIYCKTANMPNRQISRPDLFSWVNIRLAVMRIIAVVFLLFTLKSWSLAIGILDPEIRFDTLPIHWQVAIAVLVVLQPVTALGLWGDYKWGGVVWAIAVLADFLVYFVYSDLFGQNFGTLYFHAGCILFFLICFLIAKVQKHFTEKQPASS